MGSEDPLLEGHPGADRNLDLAALFTGRGIGDVEAVRRLPALPCSTRMTIRSLSMSETLSETTSEARRPAPKATKTAALYLRPGAAHKSRATSSGLKTTGSLRGSRTKGMRTVTSRRPSVTVKKNRSAVKGSLRLVAL